MSDARPGWYPDPEGVEGRYRWWDGQAWTSDLGTSVDASPPAATPEPARPRPSRRLLALGIGLVLFATAGIGAGLLIWRDPAATSPGAASSPGRVRSDPVPSAVRPQGEVEEKTRIASIGSARMVLPDDPYQLHSDPVRVPGLLDVLFVAHAPVHQRFDGKRTWSAMVGLAALDPVLAGAPDLDATALATLERLSARLFPDSRTTVRKLSVADHAVDGHAGVMITAQVHYDVARLPSRYDRVSALVVQLDDGTVVAALSSVPNDASGELTRLAAASLESLQVG